jgi:hypothetical protein
MIAFSLGLMPFLFKPDVKEAARSKPKREDPSAVAWPGPTSHTNAANEDRQTSGVSGHSRANDPETRSARSVAGPVRTRASAGEATEAGAVKAVPPTPVQPRKMSRRMRMARMFPSDGVSSADAFVLGADGQWAMARDVWVVYPKRIERVGEEWRITFNCKEELKGEKKNFVQTLTVTSKNVEKEFGFDPEHSSGKTFVVFLTRACHYFMLTLEDYNDIVNGLSASGGPAANRKG